jgi:hypothetical protein
MDEKQILSEAMPYAQARELIKDGDLIAVRDVHSKLGRLTQIVTRKPYTHTGVARWMGDRLYMADLNSGRNHLTAVSQLQSFDVCAPPIGLMRDAIVESMDAWLASPIEYGFAAFVAIGIRCLLRWQTLFNNWRSVVVCSGGTVEIYEAAANVQYKAGRVYPRAWMRHNRMLSPGELVDELPFKLAVRPAAA